MNVNVPPSNELRLERDRYVAFAFAAADLLIETDAGGRIVTITGAARSLLGRAPAELSGVSAETLFIPRDQPLFVRLMRQVERAGRSDTALLRVLRGEAGDWLVLFGGCALPSLADRRFLTLTILPLNAAEADKAKRDAKTGLLSRDALIEAANQAATNADGTESPRRLTMIHIDGLSGAISGLPEESANRLLGEIGAALRSSSADGDSAGRLGDEEFGLIVTKAGTEELPRIQEEIAAAARFAGVLNRTLAPHVVSVDLSAGELDADEAVRAIAYAVKTFAETKGRGLTAVSLKEGLEAAVESTVLRFSQMRQVIAEEAVTLVYQPIVWLSSRSVHHYEVLSRFPDGKSPFEMITFGEEVGLIEAFDLSVCRKAMEELERNPTLRLSVNVSGRSAQTARFRHEMEGMIEAKQHLARRLIFELTESAAVEQVSETAQFLHGLRRRGFAICVDDFGAGAAAYNYLRHFDLDFLKIDGHFLKSALVADKDRALIRSVSSLCNELNCTVIGEMIEDEAAAGEALSWGIRLGQGWVLGRPAPVPTPPPASISARARLAWRDGWVDAE